VEFVVQNWQQVFDDTYYLFEKIKDSGFVPDLIVGIARGGWIPARLIADFLHLKHTANMKVEAYQMIGDEEVEAKITQSISANIKDKKVLVVDDVADSGATLQSVLDVLKEKSPKMIKTAMLYYKPRSSVVPDYYVHRTNAWVVFAWSLYEAMADFDTMWSEEGMSQVEIMEKCKSIGLPVSIINSYFSS
jgi:hypoxanthine phosphoribosyltransferase